MSSALATIQTDPQAQSTAIQPKSSKIERVTGKIAAAIEAMVWQGLPRAKAAEAAGISEHGLYKALRKPPVKAHYLSECEVLRTSGRARRIHRLEAMLEQDDNKAAVINAALALDRVSDEALSRSAQSVPGLQIVIVQGGVAGPTDAQLTRTTVDASKMIDVSDG